MNVKNLITGVSTLAFLAIGGLVVNKTLKSNKEHSSELAPKKFQRKYKLVKRSISNPSQNNITQSTKDKSDSSTLSTDKSSAKGKLHKNKKGKISSKTTSSKKKQKLSKIDSYNADQTYYLDEDSDKDRTTKNTEGITYATGTKKQESKKSEDVSSDSSSSSSSSSSSKTKVIKGSIPALIGSITKVDSSIFINEAYSANCVNPKIELFNSQTMSVVADNPINEESLKSTTDFTFDPEKLQLDVEIPTKYILRTSGCSINYQRIITSFYETQNLGPATTLISSIIRSSFELDLETIDSYALHKATQELEDSTSPTDSEEEVYTKLEATLGLKEKFQQTFEGNGPELLLSAAPEISEINVDELLKEKTNYTYTVNTSHWNQNYDIAYEWILNDTKVSNNASWSFTPSANSPTAYDVVLKVGRKNSGDFDVDTSFPYHLLEYTIPIEDTFETTAPNFNLNIASSNPTANKNIVLDIQTGAEVSTGVYANCETFSNIAITEDDTFPTDTDFNIACTTATTQSLNYLIQKATDGIVDINIWAIDVNGNRSSAKILSIEVDTTEPTMAFNSLATNYRADRTIDIKWDVTEKNNDGTENFIVDFFDGSSWSNIGNVASVAGEIDDETYTLSFDLPNILVSNARFRVTFNDSLGNTKVLESSDIAINKPVLAISPTTHNYSDTLNLSNGTNQAFTVSNSGQASADFCSNPTLSGANTSEFEITTDNCSSNDLAVSSSCNIIVRPTPTTKGAKSATLNWTCGSDSVSSNLSYNSINNAPVAPNDFSNTTNEDTPLAFNVNIGNDIDGDSLTYSIVTSTTQGTLTNCMASDVDLSCLYTPAADYNGSDSFTYKVNDGTTDSLNVTTVSLTINPVNDAPIIGSDQSFTTDEDTPLNITLSPGSDIDIPAQTLSYKLITAPTNGVLSSCIDTSTYKTDRDCTYSPNLNYNGSDSFTYEVYDGDTNSVSTATVTFTINSVNDAPQLAAGQAETTAEDTVLNFNLNPGTDVDLDTLSYIVVSSTSNGTLNCTGADGSTCTYTPSADFNGTDSFTYKANDGATDSNTVTVNLTITAVNDAPTVASTQAVTTDEDTLVNFNLNSGSDIDSATLTYSIVTNPSDGTLTCTGGTSTDCSYAPAANQNGTRTFTYKVNDGSLDSNTATVTITINAINDAPVMVADQSFTTDEDTSYSVTLNGATDEETATGSIQYKITSAPTNGTLTNCTDTISWNTDITCDYAPTADFNGSDSFTYKAYDGALESISSSTVSITITPVNDAPTVASTQAVTTDEDTLVNFNLNSGSDIDSATLTYSIVTNPSDGTLTCTGGTSTDCSYAPAANQNGTRTFTYKVDDGSLDSNTATVTITINAINDAPVMVADQSFTTDEDTSYSVTLNGATDEETATGSIQYKITSAPTNGTLTNCTDTTSWNTDITCDYAPTADFNGSDSFTYKAYDGVLESAVSSTVSITINSINDAPTLAATQTVSTDEDTVLNFSLNAGADVENDTLSYIVITQPAVGTLNCTEGTSRDCIYTPDNNDNGTETFTYKVNDGSLDSTVATVTINITAQNDPPQIAANQSFTTDEDVAINFNIDDATDVDIPAQTITYKIISAPSNGVLSNCITTTPGTDLSCTYTPNADYFGADSFTYRANDGLTDSSSDATVSFTVNAINDAPTVASTQSVSTNEDTLVNFNLNSGTDVDSGSLTYSIVSSPSDGTLTCTGGTSTNCDYTPAANQNGTRTFTYKVNDGSLDSNIATVTITINAINDAPVMVADQSFTTDEDTSYSVTLNGATDEETATGSIQYKITSAPTNGTLTNCTDTTSWNTDIICDYAPNANFNGADSFTYKAYDGVLESVSTSSVSITINSINDAPTVASTQAESTNEDTVLNFNLNSGSDIESDSLTYTVVTPPSDGTLSCTGGTSTDCSYTPAPNVNGTRTFTYKVNDGSLDSNIATVTITINAINDAPVMLADQSFTTNEDVTYSVTLNGATDQETATGSIQYKITSAPTNGTLTNCTDTTSWNTDIICDYNPTADFNGSDSFTYKAYDGVLESSTSSTVSITVTPVNDAPTVAATQSISTDEDTLVNFNLNSGSDIDSGSLTYIIVAAPSDGTLTCTGGTSTNCDYTPAPNENGTRTFTYKVNDGSLDSNTATVTITINAVNDAPVMLADQSFSTNEDTAYSVTLNGATDQETATGSIQYKITTTPTNGTLTNCTNTTTWNTDITCDYSPSANFNGSDSFTYRAYDGVLESATSSTVSITVSPVNDAPTLAATQSTTTNEDTVKNFNLTAGSDIDGDTLSYVIVATPASGSLSCTGGTSRACTYTPASNFNGSTTFTYKVNDGALDSTTNTVTINITAVNDAPTLASTQSVTTAEDTLLSFNLTAGADTENDTLSYIVVSTPSNGTLSCTGGTSRACDYTPSLNFNGTDTFTYKVNDGSLDSTNNTVTVTVTPVNDAPIKAADQSISTNEDTVKNFTLNSGSDVDGDALTYIIVTNGSNGSVNCTAQSCTYTPNANYNGSDSFTYKVNDSAMDSVANTTVTVTVNSINDAPVMAADQSYSTDDNVTLSFSLSSATDVDLDTLSYKVISAPSNGTLSSCITTGSYGSDITCDYDANANFDGVDSFTFIANDGTIDAASVATVTITVTDKTAPAAPAIALSSSLYTNSTATTFTASNCTDTPSIYFNEGTQPSAGAGGWQACTTSASALAYTLASTTQGIHGVKAWSKDSNGNVSNAATNINITYDTVLPSISTVDPVALKGGSSNTLNWTTTELNSSTSLNYTVSFYNGSSWSTLGTKSSSNGPLSSSPFNYSWTTPSLDITNAKFKVEFTDLAGNYKSVSSVDFDVDSTPPALTVTSPADGSYHTSSATVTGNCETGTNVNFSGDIQTSFDIACTGGTFSQLINFSNGDGTKNIVTSQTDTAGNITSDSRNLIRDEVAPSLAKTGGASPDFTKNNTPNQWSGTCEGTYTISVTGDETTSFACSSGTWSWTPSPKTVDGNYSYSLIQTDGAGNASTSLSLSWDRDATPPSFEATSPFTASAGGTITETTNHDSLTFSGSCEGTNSIVITGDNSSTIGCSSTNWSWTTPTYSTDGTRNFVLTQSDPAGNTSDITIAWTRDTTGPALTIAENSFKTNQNTQTFSGDCEAGLTINVTGSETTTTSCTAGAWTWVTTSETTDATRTYNFAQTNATSNTTTVIGTWIRETNKPTISALSTTATNPTTNPNIPMSMTATSQNTDVGISHICIKSNDVTEPLVDDQCWVAVNDPSIGLPVTQVLNLSGNYYHLLGWNTNVSIPVYAWVKDEATNISTLTNSGSGTDTQDKLIRVYDPGVPPTIADVTAANTASTPNPPTRAQSAVPAGSDVYIRYKVTDNSAFPTGAISIYYSQDEINFTLISGAEALNANTNNGCTGYTLEANEGCFKWTGGSPYNNSYKIRVKVTDSTDLSAQSISNPLNSDTIKIIAGNTESGLGGSALSAMFFTRKNGSESDPGSLVVTDNGTIYFNDYKRGILVVDPQDGKQKIFIAKTGASSGDGGAATNATINYAVKIALDFQNRLLILDKNRIRRVNLNEATPTIDTIIGGGSNTSDTISNPLDLQIHSHSSNSWSARNIPFFAMPNGDIYFMSDYGIKNWNSPTYRLRIYKAATGQITSKYASGTGDAIDNTQNILECRVSHFGLTYNPSSSQLTGAMVLTYHEDSYGTCNGHNDRHTNAYLDPETFVARNDFYDDTHRYVRHFSVTGMDGKLYRFGDRNYVDRNNWDGTHTRILGSGTRGHCVDGTVATSCNMDIQDIYVTTTGKIYFIDAGQIRTVDSDGKVVTLFGQHPAYGDNINALNARFSYIDNVARLDNGKIVTADPRSYYFKEFTIEGNINTIAGNGNYAHQNLAVDPKTQGFYSGAWWVADKSNGNIMVRRGGNGDVVRLNRSTNMWERIVGSGGTNFWDANGVAGLSIAGTTSGNQSHALPIAYGGGKLLLARMRYNNTDKHWEDFALTTYDSTNNFTQAHLAGTNGTETYTGGYAGLCASGSSAATCKVPYFDSWGNNAWWDSTNNRWILAGRSRVDRQVWAFTPGGNAVKLAQTARNIDGTALWLNESGTDVLYYCYGNKFYKHNITTDTDLGALSWPISNLYCRGLSIDYNPTNNSIIFPFEQNGLYGIGEYFLP